ncbi:MAG: regulatory protein TetR [Caulobacteraceae bacterium]|nr:regulatory protein TetR [Caulobacteraceae bacterium]
MAGRTKVAGRVRGPTHRTHEERSALTQQKLIEAAIFCLHRYGYSATTTTLVSEVAELSRGAMVHHFGTKVDLMLAVAKYVVDDQNKFMDEALRAIPRGVERFVGLTETTWEAMSQPGAIALLEIMMASRSDEALAARFPQLADELAEIQREGAWRIASNAGITDRAAIDAMGTLHRAAMQGLSVLLMFTPKPQSLDPSLNLLHWYKTQLAAFLIANANDPKAVSPTEGPFASRSAKPKATKPEKS